MKNRRLAAVMFTDIEGYTALMQTDEAAAMRLRNRHRDVFEAQHSLFNGEVIQYFGDGTLSIFQSSRDAVECAMAMQRAFGVYPKVPLRIGIHLGEILVQETEIAGDAVNVASRVESLGVSGSILISAKVYDDIKNQRGIQTESMGEFEFKNVEQATEVFAISNPGLVVPDPESISGKTKTEDFHKESKSAFWTVIKDLWVRKVFLVAAIYLFCVWGMLQGVSFLISKYAISPYWSDIMLVFFISFLPSVILHSYYHNKLEMYNLRLVEKITIPSNGILSIALLIFLFGSKDLGATIKTVVSQDEFGNTVEKKVVKKEFRKKVNFYSFSNETGDSTLDWLSKGMAMLIATDLEDEEFIWGKLYAEYPMLRAMLEHAESQNVPLSLTGTIEKEDSLYTISSRLYRSSTGRLIQERKETGVDLFSITDRLSLALRKDLDFPDYHLQNTKDLPVKTLLTDQLNAFRFFIEGKYDKAANIDSTFAVNHFVKAKTLHQYQLNKAEAKSAIEKAMRHRSRVADSYDMQIRTLYYHIHDQPEKALALQEMQAELNPEDTDAFTYLIEEYQRNGNHRKALATCQKLEQLFPGLTNLQKTQAQLHKLMNQPEEGLALMEPYVDRFPNDLQGYYLLGDLHLAMNQLDRAEKVLAKGALLYPEDAVLPLLLDHIQYLRSKDTLLSSDILQAFTGHYRYAHRESEVFITQDQDKLFSKGRSQVKRQLYPINDSTFVTMGQLKKTFIRDPQGQVISYLAEHRGNIFEVFKLDSTILKADSLWHESLDYAALTYYEAAYKKHPAHHFLAPRIKHLRFKRSAEGQEDFQNWITYTGQHQLDSLGLLTISQEGDQLWASINDQPKTLLLPIGIGRFFLVLRGKGVEVSFITDPESQEQKFTLASEQKEQAMPDPPESQ